MGRKPKEVEELFILDKCKECAKKMKVEVTHKDYIPKPKK